MAVLCVVFEILHMSTKQEGVIGHRTWCKELISWEHGVRSSYHGNMV